MLVQWKWMWLTLPVGAHGNANVPGVPAGRRGVIDGEVGAVISSARFEDSKLGTLTATFAYIDLPTFRVSSTNVTLENLLPTQVPLLLATEKNAGYVMRTEMKHADFMPFTDALGTAQVPRTQTLSVGTTLFEAAISFSTHATDYVRLPLRYVDDEGKWQVCSAFRATHSRASLYVARKLTRIEVLALREGTPARGIHATAINELAASIHMPVKELLAKDVDANIVPCKTMPSRTPNETDMCLTLVESRVDHNALEFAYHAPYAQPNTSTDGSLLAVENTTPDAVVMVSEAGADLVKPGEQGSAAMLTLDASALDGTDLLPPSSAMADSLPHTTTSEEVDASGARGSEYIADATFAPAQHVPEYTAPMHAGDDEEGHHHPPTSAHAPTQPHTASASGVPAEPGHANTVEEAAAIELAQELEDGARAAVHASHGSSAAARATPTLEPMELGDPTPLSHKRQHAASDDAAQPAATSGMEQPAPPPAPTLP
ncbi:hypothetical protein EON67_01595 [archaeon]|nr:MAG: hypothetical protein EON67_01595 [archaeon]